MRDRCLNSFAWIRHACANFLGAPTHVMSAVVTSSVLALFAAAPLTAGQTSETEAASAAESGEGAEVDRASDDVAVPDAAEAAGTATVDYSRVETDDVAAALGLSDEQKAEVRAIIGARDAAVANADEAARPQVRAEASAKLGALLNPDQRRLFGSLFGERTLRFNFRYQKWEDVLDWVAQEADLSLVMDAEKSPPGTFHYLDSNDYSPTEAIDLLNGWLLTKGFALIRRDRMLMCVDLKSGLPEGAIPRITPAELPLRGRFELVSVLLPLEGRPPAAVLAEVKPLLGTYGRAEVLSQTGQLLVQDTVAAVRTVEQTVRKVPVPRPPDPAPKPPDPPKPILVVYPIAHANPAQAAEVLKQLITGAVVADAAAKQISISAIPAEHDKAKAIIHQLEENQGPGNASSLQLHSLSAADPSQVLATLKLVVPAAQLRPDSVTGKLVAWATAEDHGKITDTLQQLQADSSGEGNRQLEVYPLPAGDPLSVSTILQTLLPTARITTDAAKRSLVIVGTLTDHQAARGLIEQLTAGTLTSRLVVYPAENIDVSSVTSLLGALVPDAKITSDLAHQRLLVIASDASHATVAAALEQVRPDDAAVPPVLRSYPLHPRLTAASITTLLSSLLPKVAVTNDEKNRRLLITAREADHAVVAQVMRQLEQDTGGQVPELQFYPLQKATGAGSVSILTAIAPGAQISWQEDARRLTVVATADDHAAITATLRKLEASAPEQEKRELKIYSVTTSQRARFQSVAAGLTAELPGLQVITDGQPGELAVWATPTQQAVVAEVLSQLQHVVPPEQQSKLIVYPIRKVDPSGVAEVLTPLFPDAKITADAKASRVLVHAREALHEAIRAAIEQLDSDLPQEREIRLMAYPVQGIHGPTAMDLVRAEVPGATVISDPTAETLIVRARLGEQERVAELLDSLRAVSAPLRQHQAVSYPAVFSDQIRTTEFFSAAFPGARAVMDAANRRMMVWATKTDHQKVRELVTQMSGPSEDGVLPTLGTYPVSGLATGALTTLLGRAVPDAQLVFSSDGRQLLVWARPDDQSRVEQIVSRAREGAGADDGRLLEIYSVRGLGPAVSSVLSQAVPQAGVSAGAGTGQLAITATPEEHAKVRRILDQLAQTSQDPATKTLSVHDIRGVTAAAVQQVLQPLLDPDVQITIDAAARRLFVRAWPEQQQRIQDMITEITGNLASAQDRTTRTYLAGASQGDEAQKALSALYPDATIVTDRDRTMIIATATSAQHETIARVMEEMAGMQQGANTAEARVYPLTAADGDAAVEVLQRMFGRRDEVRISYDRRSRSVVVLAAPRHQRTVQSFLEQLDRVDPEMQRDRREVDVIQLRILAATSAKMSIEGLFRDATTSTADLPLIEADDDTQQLLIRASPRQLQEIRTLLIRMGETGLSAGTAGEGTGRGLRVIPIQGDVDAALQKIQNLWPRLRSNPLRIVRPVGNENTGAVPDDSQPQKPQADSDRPADHDAGQGGPAQFSVPPETVGSAAEGAGGASEESPPQPSSSERPADRPAVMIVAGSGRLTIASEDIEALDQMEGLLRTVLASPGGNRNRDFAVFQLRNAGADDIARTLRSVYESRAGILAFGSVVLVPEPRMNALIVYGSRADRERIAQLLEVLDTEKLPDSGRAFRTQVVPVRFADAKQIEAVLRGAYRAELVAGGARQTIDIPSGVPASVASVLRQINAAASSPLLTIEVQRDTNSLVLKAPQTLLDEVIELIARLDETASTSRARGITLVPLRKTNATRVMRMIKQVLD